MCGRNTIFSDKNKIKKELKVDIWKNEEVFNPTYNLSPTQNSPVLVKNNKRAIYPMRWGFGFKSSMKPIFNARAETLEKKQSFLFVLFALLLQNLVSSVFQILKHKED